MFPLLLFFSTPLLLLLATTTLCSKKKVESNEKSSSLTQSVVNAAPASIPTATSASTHPTSPKEPSPKKSPPKKKEASKTEKKEASKKSVKKEVNPSVEEKKKKKEEKKLEPEVPIDKNLPMAERLQLMNNRLSSMGREECHREFPHEDDDCRCNEYMDKFCEYWNINLKEPDTLWNLWPLWDKRNTMYYLDKDTGRMERVLTENPTQKSDKDEGSCAEKAPAVNGRSLLTEEEIEPYVRRKRATGESRKKMIGLNDEEQNVLRTSINSRERKRMHDLNDAHEELRSCLPYGQEANARKLSKISTIMLASNWIRQLTKENSRLTAENEALRRQTNTTQTVTQPPPPPQPLTLLPPGAFSLACVRPFGQSCFCIGCVTQMAKKET